MGKKMDKGFQQAADKMKSGQVYGYNSPNNNKSNNGQYKEDGHIIGWILILFMAALWAINRFF